MTEIQKIQFYSGWEYSSVRLLTSIKDMQSIETIAERLGLPSKRVREVIDFLLSCGLCVEKNGRIETGPIRTFLPAGSPLVKQHHLNWRFKGLQALDSLRKHELAFTAPMTLSLENRDAVKEILRDAIEKMSRLFDRPQIDEELCCLVIDWFDVRKTANE
jgi:hypothetical protein